MARALRKRKKIGPRRRIARGLPVGAKIKCSDNSGAKVLQIIGVKGYRGPKNRLPSASVGDLVIVAVKEGKPDLVHTVQRAVIIRQRAPFRRKNGEVIMFEDNAAVLIKPDNSPRGTEIKGPVAREAIERFPALSGVASMVV